MTESKTKSKRHNPTMEVALTAESVAKTKSAKRKLSEPSGEPTEGPVSLAYLEGFHRQS